MAIGVRLDQKPNKGLHLARQAWRAKYYDLHDMIEGGLDGLEDFYRADAAMAQVYILCAVFLHLDFDIIAID